MAECPFVIPEAEMFNRTQKKWIVAGTVRAALLARVSTNTQLDNSSPDDQLQRCRAYCQAKEYAVIVEKIESVSGMFVLAREVFQELLEMGKAGELDVIVVDVPDRLGRGDASAQLEMQAKMAGLRVEYARNGRDTSTMEGIALKAVDQIISGGERINTRRRTMDGKNARAREGRIIQTRFRQFGYRYRVTFNDKGKIDSSKIEIIEEEAEVVRMIFDWYVYDGLTLYGVAKRLNEQNIPSPSRWTQNGSIGNNAIGSDGLWRRATLARMLKCSTYKGQWRWGKQEHFLVDTTEGPKKRLGRMRTQEETPIVPCPAIVETRTWDMAQSQLELNRGKFMRPTKNVYLLRSRVRCGMCGSKMVGITNATSNPISYYRCHRCVAAPGSGIKCPSKRVKAELLDTAVWNYITEVIMDEKTLFSGLRLAREKTARKRQIIESSIAGLLAKNARAQADVDRLVDMHLNDEIDRQTFRSKKEKIGQDAEKRLAEIADLNKRLAEHAVVSEEDEVALRNLRSVLSRRISSPNVPPSEKARVLDILKVACIWDERTGELAISGLIEHVTLSLLHLSTYQCNASIPFGTVLSLFGVPLADLVVG